MGANDSPAAPYNTDRLVNSIMAILPPAGRQLLLNASVPGKVPILELFPSLPRGQAAKRRMGALARLPDWPQD